MALVNGSDYDHIDLHSAAGGDVTRHMLKDAQARGDVSELKSTMTPGYITGFNIWDEQWEVGEINSSNGQNNDNPSFANTIRSKNYIPVLPETEYYFCFTHAASGSAARLRFYSSDKSYIGYLGYGDTAIPNNSVFKTPSNCYYMRFATSSTYGATYNNDYCINFSQPDTTMEPYNGQYRKYLANDNLLKRFFDNAKSLINFITDHTNTPAANMYPKFSASGTLRSNDPTNTKDALILDKGLYCGIIINDPSLIVSPYDDFDTFPSNKTVCFLTSAAEIAHCPSGFTTGTVVTLSTSSTASVFRTQIANSGSRMWFRTKYGSTWSDFKEVNSIPADTIPYTLTKIYVAPTGNDSTGDGSQLNPFATIYHANETITDNSEQHRYQIIVADGTYTDLQTRYYGVGVTDDYQGIICKDYVDYIGNVKKPGACVISWNGATGLTNPTYNDVKMKCPFHIRGGSLTTGRHTKVRGFKIVGKNLRYCMHIDTGGLGDGVEWEVTDCIFDWSGRPDITDYSSYGDGACIGTGTSNFEKGKFARCEVSNAEGITMGYQAHDTVRNAYYAGPPAFVEGADITIESCNFNGANIQFRSIYANATTEGYDRVHLINAIGVGIFEPSPNSGVTNKWKAEIKCSNITTNNFVNDFM